MITTPCAVCADKATEHPSYGSRGERWPTTEVAGLTVHKCCASELEHVATAMTDGSIAVDETGVATWTTNGSVPPADCLSLFALLGLPGLDLVESAIVRDRQIADTIAAYTTYRQATGYSPEELHEMRNAFGEDADVVDVITGQRVPL